MNHCKSIERLADDGKPHRWCIVHRAWFWQGGRRCGYAMHLEPINGERFRNFKPPKRGRQGRTT